MSLWPLLLLSALVSFVVTKVSIRFSEQRGVLDLPNVRSSHSHPVPRLGGMGILAALVLSVAAFALVNSIEGAGMTVFTRDVALLLAAGVGMALTGLYDDWRGMKPITKFLIQFILAAIIISLGTRFESIAVLNWGPFALGMFAIPLTVFWLTGFANLCNFMDGINGLTAVSAAVFSAFFFVFATWKGRPDLAAAAVAVAGGCLGFLPYNLPRARTFMGDTGSQLLGIVLALLVVQLAQRSANPASLAGLLLVCSAYIWDAGFTLLRRLLRRENIFQAHRSHLYQRLGQLGLSHARITGLYLLLHLTMGFLGLAYVQFAIALRPVILAFAALILLGFTMTIYGLEDRAAKAKREAAGGAHSGKPRSDLEK